jgi:ADP-ribose pyrophosphatase YjhB (NUDIX family)
VRREVREEAGLDVEPERVLGVFGGARMRHRYPNGDEAEYTSIIFACRVVGGRLEAGGGSDGGCVRVWLPQPER